jgi:hypothetical protein
VRTGRAKYPEACPNEADPELRVMYIGEVCRCCYDGYGPKYQLPRSGSARATRSPLTPGQQKSHREGKAEYAERKERAARLSRRIGLPIEASKPYDWHAQARGGDPLPDPFTKGLPRGMRHLPVMCKLGRGEVSAECDSVLRAMAQVADKLGARWRIRLVPSGLSFDLVLKQSEMEAWHDAARRLAAKFGAHYNLYYAHGEPWGADISATMYFYD